MDGQALVQMVVELLSRWGLKLLGALALLLAGRIAAGWTRRQVRRVLLRAKVEETLIPFFGGLAYWVVLVAVGIAVLGVIGIQTASLLAVLGAAGLAVGLALQGSLANFSSGVMLLLFRPFQVGDYIDAGGTAGTVQAIGLFATTLNTPDNVRVIAPNASVYGQTIKNYASNETRRNDLVVGISYEDDIGKAIETIHGVLRADSRVLADPAPTVAVAELADSSVNLVVRPWCNKGDYWALRFDLTRLFKERLEEAGCSIPYPQRTVHVHQAGSA